MGTKRLTERVTFAGGKVDRTGKYPVIRDVLFCGSESANKRRYKSGAFGSGKLYEGKAVCIDHATSQAPRGFLDKVGWVENERRRADGMPIGDIGINPKHAEAESVLWAAENKPDYCGMSHVAQCKTESTSDGWESVEQVLDVDTLDIVIDPATTRGFYESKGQAMSDKISLKKFGERFGPKWGPVKWSAFTKLCEDMGAVADAPVMDAPAEEATEGDMKSALMSALAPMLDEAFESGDATKAVAALKDFIKLHAKHTGKGNGGGGGESDSSGDSDSDSKDESRKPKLPDSWTVLEECRAKGLKNPTGSQLRALAKMPDVKERAEFITDIIDAFKGGAETPQSAGRQQLRQESIEAGSQNAPPTISEIKARMKG